MNQPNQTPSPKRILLAGVFGPFGVDDEFGRKENIMELFHNQVTREQGLASFRFQHRSFGLYFLAENLNADVTVLDFPSLERFKEEIVLDYDAVGISFITPNFVKAQEMAKLTRILAPHTEIILGGHGAAVEGVEDSIDCDHVVKGEGIAWLRQYVGQDVSDPIVHPVLQSTEKTRIFGVPVPGQSASLLVPGVGCVNACRFCSTSHFFGRAYTPYLATGRELFEACCHIADVRKTEEFFVMDENFLKDKKRALELLAEMEANERFFEFEIFSSAEAILDFGLDNLERLGVNFVWIGVESGSTASNYQKNEGVDAKALVKQLRNRGILVLASGILCHEDHTPANIRKDIDFMVELEADLVQFMLLIPLPVTALYAQMRRDGLLREDLPLEEWHGQKELSYRHPTFRGGEPERWIKKAFVADYETNGSSMLRVIDTTLRGVRRLRAKASVEPALIARKRRMEKRLREWGIMTAVIRRHPVNDAERSRAEQLDLQINLTLNYSRVDGVKKLAARGLSTLWSWRLKAVGDHMQPDTIYTRYPVGVRNGYVTKTRLSDHCAVASDVLSHVG